MLKKMVMLKGFYYIRDLAVNNKVKAKKLSGVKKLIRSI